MRIVANLLLVLALCWAVAVAWGAVEAWPTVPMDLNPNDPEVSLAYGAAVRRFVVQHAISGGAPLLLALAVWWLMGRRPTRT
jgi:hypothetical protein